MYAGERSGLQQGEGGRRGSRVREWQRESGAGRRGGRGAGRAAVSTAGVGRRAGGLVAVEEGGDRACGGTNRQVSERLRGCGACSTRRHVGSEGGQRADSRLGNAVDLPADSWVDTAVERSAHEPAPFAACKQDEVTSGRPAGDAARVPEVGPVRALPRMNDDQDDDAETSTSRGAERAARPPAKSGAFRPRRVGAPIPGFPSPATRRVDDTAGEGPAVLPGVGATGAERIDPRAARRMLSVRVSAELYGRYERILHQLDLEGVDSSMTEIVSALLYVGPQTADDARQILRYLRRARDASL